MKDSPTVTVSDVVWAHVLARVKGLQRVSLSYFEDNNAKVSIEVLPKGKQSYHSEEQIRLYAHLIASQRASDLFVEISQWIELIEFHYDKNEHAISIFISIDKIEEINGN